MKKKKGKREVIYIPGDRVSRKDLLDQIDTQRIKQYEFRLERIRTSDLSEDQKRIQSSFIRSHISYIRNMISDRERN